MNQYSIRSENLLEMVQISYSKKDFGHILMRQADSLLPKYKKLPHFREKKEKKSIDMDQEKFASSVKKMRISLLQIKNLLDLNFCLQ